MDILVLEMDEISPFLRDDELCPEGYAVINVTLESFTTTTTLSPKLMSDTFPLSPSYITLTDEARLTFLSPDDVSTVMLLSSMSATVPTICSFVLGLTGLVGFVWLVPASSFLVFVAKTAISALLIFFLGLKLL